jgi:hypothetical protein
MVCFIQEQLLQLQFVGRSAPSVQTNQVLPIGGEQNRSIDCIELVHAFQNHQSNSQAKTQNAISFKAFPESVQEKLKELDTSGDGQVDANEILAGIEALHRERNKARQMLIAVGILILLVCILLGGTALILASVIDASKESRIGSSGAMLVKGSNETVRVGAVDFTVVNGVLASRDPQSCNRSACPPSAIQVSEVSLQISCEQCHRIQRLSHRLLASRN